MTSQRRQALTLLNAAHGKPAVARAFWSVKIELNEDGSLPTAVRLFAAGWNTSENGDYLFDERAAELTMAAYNKHGVPVMIDLEHLSIAAKRVTGDARNFDPDARGRGKFGMRGGDLWIHSIKWTQDGEDRVRNRKQEYLSPAFAHDDDRRIIRIYNIALTAMPATDFAPALVAASTTRGNETMTPEQIRKLLALLRDGKTPADALNLLSIDVKTLQAVVKAMGGDPNADLATMMGTVSAFAQSLVDAASGKSAPEQEEPAAEEPAAEEPAAATATATVSADAHELQLLREDAKKQAAEIAVLRKERHERGLAERCHLVGQLVVLGRETPASAWVDGNTSKPRGSLANMPLEELRERVKLFGGSPAALVGVPAPTPPAKVGVRVLDNIEMSEYELNRLHRVADRHKVPHEDAEARYCEIKRQQITGAEGKGDRRLCRMVARPIDEPDVLSNVHGRMSHSTLVTLSTPVKPIEEFGATSQRALEEFRIEHMGALASQPKVWAEDIGEVLPGGSLKDTYPIDFAVSKYRKKVGASAPARTSNVKELSVSKELYHEAEECELIRLVRGDFAYLKSWQNKAQRMARARVFLRNHLIATLLEANGTWSPDGVAFFATTHKVDPFNASRTFRGAATWANLQDGTAAPLDADSLTAEKNLFLYSTPGPDGEELGFEADGVLYPTILNETVRNMLTVQDLILSGVLAGDGDGTMGQVRNPHYQSGLAQTRAPELTGTAVSADWYLYSLAAIQAGLVPWILSEDASEEIRIWDESSDFYKNGTGFIKYESLIYIAGLLVYPHGIRKIQGT